MEAQRELVEVLHTLRQVVCVKDDGRPVAPLGRIEMNREERHPLPAAMRERYWMSWNGSNASTT